MPNRTYIEMLLKLHNNGKIHLSKVVLYFLNRYNIVLEKHPEAIEEIVKKRVNIVGYIRTINPNIKMTWLNYVIYEQCFLDSMFADELGIKSYRIIGTSKATGEEKIINDNLTKEEAEKFCELWGWSYDDGEHSYFLGYEAKPKEEWQKC